MKIYCTNIKRYVDVTGGETLHDIYQRLKDEIGIEPIYALVNNRAENLSFPVFMPKQVEYMDYSTATGTRVYVRSLCMVLYKAVSDLMKGNVRLSIDHSVSGGWYCLLKDYNAMKCYHPTLEELEALKTRMREIVDEDHVFVRKERLTSDVIKIFERQGLADKVKLLSTTHNLYTTYYKLGDLADSYYGPMAYSTGALKVFDLKLFKEGFLLLGRDPKNRDVPQQPVTQEKMYEAFKDYLKFNRAIRISTVGDLNMAVKKKMTSQLINVAEAMHEKALGKINSEIARRREEEGGARVVLLAGPSSSGKTTTTKRLAIQLMTNLLTPKMISLDDYFVDRHLTPKDENGEYDYESLYALDLERLNSDLNRLLRGEEIQLPTYSFELGRRIDRDRPLRLEADEVLLIEGIHGLNPELTADIPQQDIFKIYVSALTTLRIDDHNWIPTTDNRLLRRIVRDHKYRNTSALETIRRWASVRRGEEKWIFPFQENADATFNSSLIFELGVMKPWAEPMLQQVPHDCPEYAEAYRLIRFLDYFETIPAEQVPSTSLLREFLGGSSFHY